MAVEMGMDDGTQRFVALHLHKEYVMVAALDAQKRVVLSPRRVLLDPFAGWATRHLQRTDQVVLEATTNAWYIYASRPFGCPRSRCASSAPCWPIASAWSSSGRR